jgi:hypothetical protein
VKCVAVAPTGSDASCCPSWIIEMFVLTTKWTVQRHFYSVFGDTRLVTPHPHSCQGPAVMSQNLHSYCAYQVQLESQENRIDLEKTRSYERFIGWTEDSQSKARTSQTRIRNVNHFIWTFCLVGGWIDAWMDGWMEGWTGRQTDTNIFIHM